MQNLKFLKRISKEKIKETAVYCDETKLNFSKQALKNTKETVSPITPSAPSGARVA